MLQTQKIYISTAAEGMNTIQLIKVGQYHFSTDPRNSQLRKNCVAQIDAAITKSLSTVSRLSFPSWERGPDLCNVHAHTSKDSKHKQENRKDEPHWSPQDILMEDSRDDNGREKCQLVVHTAVKKLNKGGRWNHTFQ